MSIATIEVTGHGLRTAIAQWELRRDVAVGQFADSLKAFPDEDKPNPRDLTKTFLQCEEAIAGLQVVQATYNLTVKVKLTQALDATVFEVPLAHAIKIVGGRGRIEKMWRGVAAGTNNERRYGNDDDERDPSKIRSKATVTRTEASAIAATLSKGAAKVRQAIAEANGTRLALPVEAAWLE